MTGNIYLGTSERYAVDYYSTGSDDPDDPQELLMTYEYEPSDLVKGDPNEKDQMTGGTEIIVKRAKLIAVKNLTADKQLFEGVEHMHKNTQKIIYNGYIFEAVKVNKTIDEYAKNILSRILNKDFRTYVGTIETNKTENKTDDRFNNKTYEIKTLFLDSPRLGAEYRTTYKDYRGERKQINERLIELHIDVEYISNKRDSNYLYKVYASMIHELLHAIDPKSIDTEIINKLPKYIYGNEDIEAYQEQPQERQVILSSRAHTVIRNLISSHTASNRTASGVDYKKIYNIIKDLIVSGEILQRMKIVENDKNVKEFLKLCYYYLEQELGQYNGKR